MTTAWGCVLLAVSSAGPEADAVTLKVTRQPGAEACPDAPSLASMVPSSSAPLRFDVDFSPTTSGGFAASIRGRGAMPGERRLLDAGPTCEPLASAVAVILAVMADEAVAQRPALRAERPAPTAPASPSSVALEAGGGISAGIIRSVAATAMVGASFSLSPHVLLAAELEASPAETVALSPGTVGIQFFYGSIRACLRTAPSSRFEIGACVAPYLGEIWAEGHGFSRDASASLTWPALGAGLRASGVLWGSLRWLAQAGLVVPALRESFSVDNAGTAYVPPRVAWVATGGLGWELR